jgi:hypothetical protein
VSTIDTRINRLLPTLAAKERFLIELPQLSSRGEAGPRHPKDDA